MVRHRIVTPLFAGSNPVVRPKVWLKSISFVASPSLASNPGTQKKNLVDRSGNLMSFTYVLNLGIGRSYGTDVLIDPFEHLGRFASIA